jgi:hypothetical protein
MALGDGIRYVDKTGKCHTALLSNHLHLVERLAILIFFWFYTKGALP